MPRSKKNAPAPSAGRPSDDPDALRQLMEDTLRKNAEALRRAELPPSVEPAFVFRA